MGIFRTARLAPSVLAAALAVGAAAVPPVVLAAPEAAAESPGPESSRTGGPHTGDPRTAGPGSPEAAVRVMPARVRPGTEIELWALSCEGTVATARSEAFVADARLAPAAEGRGLRGEAMIRSDAEEREHRITVECGGVKVTGRVTVDHSASPSAHGSASPSASPSVPPSAHGSAPATAPAPAVSPVAPVPAGGGGTAGEGGGEGAGDAGPGVLHTVLGIALAGTATLVAVRRTVLLRRRARSDADR